MNRLRLKKLLERIRGVKRIEDKVQTDLSELKDFSHYQKICKLHPFGVCLDMFHYGGACREESCPLLEEDVLFETPTSLCTVRKLGEEKKQ